MEITKYGVTLKRLTEDKLEMTRNWRNDPKISQYMEFQDYITPEMQAAWFKKIDNEHNYYFIIEYDNKEIGLTNIRDIDYTKKEGEGGIYIYDDNYLNTTVSYQAILCLMDFVFEDLKLDRMIAHIRQDNKRAIKYNLILGYVKQPDQENILNQLYIVSAEDYFTAKKKILRLLNY
jgi:RimJ/RimL family protein N-acetyltransferase